MREARTRWLKGARLRCCVVGCRIGRRWWWWWWWWRWTRAVVKGRRRKRRFHWRSRRVKQVHLRVLGREENGNG
ncbi:hypothetical protein IWX50DRAFT_642013 [Phyllosticta citricarpa]